MPLLWVVVQAGIVALFKLLAAASLVLTVLLYWNSLLSCSAVVILSWALDSGDSQLVAPAVLFCSTRELLGKSLLMRDLSRVFSTFLDIAGILDAATWSTSFMGACSMFGGCG